MPTFYAALTFAVLLGVIAASLRVGLSHWWRARGVRIAFGVLALATCLPLAAWIVGAAAASRAITTVAVRGSWIALAFVLPLAVAVPAAAIVWQILSRTLRTRTRTPTPTLTRTRTRTLTPTPTPTPTRSTRRAVLQWTTAALPLASLSASTSGLVTAAGPHAMPRIVMRYASLHPDLDGLRILHLTDLHLGQYMHARDVEAVLARAAALRPDLIVFTGDVADDLRELGPAMRMATALAPRLGVFAAVGNHEYFHGLARSRRAFDASPVPLLFERGTTLAVGDARLHVSGVADPVQLGGDVAPFLQRSLDRALDGAPSDAFHLLLSHRPDGLDAAAARGVELTLSGHTHGAQLGAFRRSVFEPIAHQKRLWGEYAIGASRSYTSAGFGHWFPFRLGCPPEAPLVVLERG